MQTRIITIGFSKSTLKFPILAWCILFWETIYNSIKYKKIIIAKQSHCYLKFDTRNIFNDYTNYHAAKNMIHYVPYKTFLKTNKVVKEFNIEVNYNTYWNIRKKLHEQLTLDYGILQNIGIFITDVVELITSRKLDNPWKKGYNCSEAAAEVILELKPELKDNINLNRIKPSKVRHLLETHF